MSRLKGSLLLYNIRSFTSSLHDFFKNVCIYFLNVFVKVIVTTPDFGDGRLMHIDSTNC